jgi:hypothetical protein
MQDIVQVANESIKANVGHCLVRNFKANAGHCPGSLLNPMQDIAQVAN